MNNWTLILKRNRQRAYNNNNNKFKKNPTYHFWQRFWIFVQHTCSNCYSHQKDEACLWVQFILFPYDQANFQKHLVRNPIHLTGQGPDAPQCFAWFSYLVPQVLQSCVPKSVKTNGQTCLFDQLCKEEPFCLKAGCSLKTVRGCRPGCQQL